MCKRFLALTAVCGLAVSSADAQILFTEDFDDSGAAGRWSAPIVTQEDTGIAADANTDFAFDYSTIGIPAAPGGTSTIGLLQQTNLTDQCPADPACEDSDEGEATGVVSNYTLPSSGSYKVTADLYLFWNEFTGSTEYGSFGVGHSGSPNVPLRFGLNDGDGLAWQIDTDGDSGTDILLFTGTGQLGLGGYEDIPDGSIPSVPTGATSPIGPFNQWVEVEITVTSAGSTFSVNGFEINAWNTVYGGGILLGQSDPFNSVNPPDVLNNNAQNAAIWDNVVVMTIPEPTSGLLIALGGLGLAFRRR